MNVWGGHFVKIDSSSSSLSLSAKGRWPTCQGISERSQFSRKCVNHVPAPSEPVRTGIEGSGLEGLWWFELAEPAQVRTTKTQR